MKIRFLNSFTVASKRWSCNINFLTGSYITLENILIAWTNTLGGVVYGKKFSSKNNFIIYLMRCINKNAVVSALQ